MQSATETTGRTLGDFDVVLYVRDEAGYASLMQGAYGHAIQIFQDGLLRVPYRYCVGKHTF